MLQKLRSTRNLSRKQMVTSIKLRNMGIHGNYWTRETLVQGNHWTWETFVQGNQFECKKPWFENKTLVQEEYETLLSYRETNIHKKPWYREFTEQKNFSTWKLLNTRNLSNNKLFECGKSWYRKILKTRNTGIFYTSTQLKTRNFVTGKLFNTRNFYTG